MPKDKEYQYIEVESFIPEDLKGRHGQIHIRPTNDQGVFRRDMVMQCNKMLSKRLPSWYTV